MIDVYVNYLAVVVAAVANMALGFVWYGPLFGKKWMSLMGKTSADIDAQKTKSPMWKGYAIAFAGSLVMAFVLSHFLTFASFYTDSSGIAAGLMVGFWSWLGFVAPVTLGSVLWEGKSWNLWILVNGYYLVSALIMGSILALWM
ncbi:DUF1761 domain-containing protein [Candidatus Parcubacteria bacterium]|nr:DUF1761 domain-containing protein [Candidatus Parcubacteria bacterium]